jgi:hypothetical protein
VPEQSNILQQFQQPVTAQNDSGHVGGDGEIWDDEDSRNDEDPWDDEEFDRGFPGVMDNGGLVGDEGYGGYGYEADVGNVFESDSEDMEIGIYSLILC